MADDVEDDTSEEKGVVLGGDELMPPARRLMLKRQKSSLDIARLASPVVGPSSLASRHSHSHHSGHGEQRWRGYGPGASDCVSWTASSSIVRRHLPGLGAKQPPATSHAPHLRDGQNAIRQFGGAVIRSRERRSGSRAGQN